MMMLMVIREKRVSAKRKRHDPVKLKMCSLSSARWAGEIHEIRIDTLRLSVLTPIEYVVKYDDVQKYVVIYSDVLNFLVMY